MMQYYLIVIIILLKYNICIHIAAIMISIAHYCNMVVQYYIRTKLVGFVISGVVSLIYSGV